MFIHPFLLAVDSGERMLPLARMVVKPLLLLLAALPMVAQPPIAASGSYIGAGVSYDPSNSPKTVGHVWIALPASAKARVFSWTAIDLLYSKRQALQTAIETGGAPWLRDWGNVSLYLLAAGGAAVQGTGATVGTSGSTTVGGAFSGGGLLVIPLRNGFAVGLNVRVIKLTGATSAPSQASVGIDLIFGR